jgi:hypothetical protein
LAVMDTSVGVTPTAVLACLSSRTGTPDWGQEANGVLISTPHARTSGDPLAIYNHTHASPQRIAGESRSGGDNAAGHQSLDQTVFTLEQPGFIGLPESFPEGRLGGYIVRIKA